MDIHAVRKAVSKIRTGLFKNSNSYSVGMLKSHFKGTGLQFKEHQVYMSGDEVRFIDWKMLAKTSHPYVKTFEEERNVEIVVAIDASPSMLYGHKGISKLQAAIEICCLLYILADETSDYVHALIVADELINVPKNSGEAGITVLVNELQRHGILGANGKVNIDYPYSAGLSPDRTKLLGKHLHKKRELVLLSDFVDFIPFEYLRKIIFRRNVHCFQVLAPLDRQGEKPFVLPYAAIGSGGRTLGRIDSGNEQKSLDQLGRKLRKLNVDGPYLDHFVREMI